MKLCDYGCGQEAKYQFKNGKWCCSNIVSKCSNYRNKQSIYMKKIRKNLNSIYNSNSYKQKISNTIKTIWRDPNGIYNSSSCKKRKKSSMKKAIGLDIKRIIKRYSFFSKIEKMRYNPNKPNEKEIQVHCKNHNCQNSKEKNGWFTPTRIQLAERIRQIESKNGNGGSYFYCSQYCKDTCPLYQLHGDPLKNTNIPYTYQEHQLWRQVILKEDKGLCYFCGKPATDVHHIKPVKTHPHLALDPDNGISFCEECHYKIGHKTGTECSTGNLANKQQQGCVLGGQI